MTAATMYLKVYLVFQYCLVEVLKIVLFQDFDCMLQSFCCILKSEYMMPTHHR